MLYEISVLFNYQKRRKRKEKRKRKKKNCILDEIFQLNNEFSKDQMDTL
jgi:hypothetical protein